MTTIEQISETEAFKAITDKLRRKLLLTKESRLNIQHGVDMSRKVSFDHWVNVCSPSRNVSYIVLELISK